MREISEIIVDARNAGTPLLAIQTPDQQATVNAARAAAGPQAAHVQWDMVRGVMPLNDLAKRVVTGSWGDDAERRAMTANPQAALEVAERLPADALFIMLNAHRIIDDPFVSTGVGNLRDLYKRNGRTVVLLGPTFRLPNELRQDVIVLEEPLPNDEALAAVVRKVYKAGKLAVPGETIVAQAVDALRGLSAFAAEQVGAMSLRKDGLDMTDLWARKVAAVEQVQGLRMTLNGPSFDSHVRGAAAAIKYVQRLFAGPRPPRAIVWIDEIEKAFAGLGTNGQAGDSSGVTQRALGKLLSWMDGGGDRKRNKGMVLVGPPGSGKSLFAHAMAGSFGVPEIEFDLGGMFGSLVGESEQNIREALKTVDGVASGNAFVVATCNKLDVLPPELQRRFTSGTWYFDLPTADERELIWSLQEKAFGVTGQRPDSEGWTGAEIRNCCEHANDLACSLVEAAEYVVPISKSNPRSIEVLRSRAHQRFKSSSHDGTYTTDEETVERGRRITLDDQPTAVAVAFFDKKAEPETAAEAIGSTKTVKGES